jgi:hypothetical protein
MRSLLTLLALLVGSAAFGQGNPPMMGGYREPPKINMAPSAPPPPEAPSSAGAALAALLCIGIVLLAVCYPMRRPE